MRNRVIAGALIALSLSCLALAEADGPDFFRVVGVERGDTLNVHTKPHTKSKVIGEIAPGSDCLQNLGCRGGLTFQEYTSLSKAERQRIKRARPRWCKIRFDGMTGWVYALYLAESSCRKEMKP